MKEKKITWIKALGIVATFIGIGAELVSDWVEDQKTEQTIKEEVRKALAEEQETSEES